MVKFKKAFSIVEALISASILALVLILALRSSTTKVKEPENRGYYKCSCEETAANSGTYVLKSFYVINGEKQSEETYDGSPNRDKCIFYPAEGIDFYTINVWNTNSLIYNSLDSAYSYAVTSIPKRGTKIFLGNSNSHDIFIENILYINEIVPTGTCVLPFHDGAACGNNGGDWHNDRQLCILESGGRDEIAQRICQRAGNEYGTNGSWDAGRGVCLFPNLTTAGECVEDFGGEWYDAMPFCHLHIDTFIENEEQNGPQEQCMNQNGTWFPFGVGNNICLDGVNMEITW